MGPDKAVGFAEQHYSYTPHPKAGPTAALQLHTSHKNRTHSSCGTAEQPKHLTPPAMHSLSCALLLVPAAHFRQDHADAEGIR